MTPEEKARELIDKRLEQSGWIMDATIQQAEAIQQSILKQAFEERSQLFQNQTAEWE